METKNTTPKGQKIFKKMKFFAVEVIFPHFKGGSLSKIFRESDKNPFYSISRKLLAQDWVVQAHEAPKGFAELISKHSDRVPEVKGGVFEIKRLPDQDGKKCIEITVSYPSAPKLQNSPFGEEKKKKGRFTGIGKTSHF